MGNQQARPPPASVDVVRRPPTRPEVPPSSRPISQLGPNGPSYHSPENQVLPKEIPKMRLRPVSMELSKYNPEYQKIYGYGDMEDEENLPTNEDGNIETLNDENKSPPRPPPPLQNGHIPNTTMDKDKPISQVSPIQNENVKSDPKKVVKINGSVPYKPAHRRQMSASGSSNLTGQEHIIFEEPEENLDSRGKIDPLYQSYPGVSLPVKNNFNLDYSYQLTYVQLAEHRRQKTLEDLEKRTGKKISELSADLNDNVEKQPFIRDAYSRVSTRSTGSGGSELTNKKKKAPPPPSQPPPAPPASPSKSGVPAQKPKSSCYSVEDEPIPDYDLSESPKRQFVLPRYTVAPVQKNVPTPPPPPMQLISQTNNISKKSVSVSRTNSMSDGRPEIILKKTPSLSTPKTPENLSGQIPWLLEIKTLSESKAARRQISQESEVGASAMEMKDAESSITKQENSLNSSQAKLVFESSKEEFKQETPDLDKDNIDKEEIFALEELNKSIGEVTADDSQVEPLERKGSLKSEKHASPKLARHHSSTLYDRKSTPTFDRANSSPNDPVRRLNSLLQHDIKITAQAKCHKLIKQTTPVLPKPKDPHEIFREQLEKACTARDERVKVEGTIDEKLKTSASDASLGRVLDDNDASSTESHKTNIPENESNKKEAPERKNSSTEPPEVKPKPRYHKNVTINRTNSNQPAWKLKSKSLTSNASFETPNKASASFDWTPEDDLESDDNLSDREQMSTRKGASEGFKSSIVPNSVSDLKSGKKLKGNKYKKNPEVEDQSKNKFGSVKKIKKTVHKGVKNAFGSISKASGKLLRKQKTEEVVAVEDAPKNWKFSKSEPSVKDAVIQSKSHRYMSNGFHAVSDSEGDELYETQTDEFNDIVPNSDVNSDDETSDEGMAEQIAQNIKRAGIAYVNDKGELVVLPDEEARHSKYKIDSEPKTSKYEKKKKKKDSKQEKLDIVREKERKIEEEKRKQLELELEMHRIREAETRERLHRLEAAQLQQQINAQLLQQQQQQNYSMISAPPLPPAGVLPQNYSNRNETQQQATFPNLFNQQLPQNAYLSNPGLYGQPPAPILNGSVPNLTYNLEDYMRMLGLQTPPTSQQMAYFLNNMTLNGLSQQYDRKSNPTLYDMLYPEQMKQSCNMQAIDPNANKQYNVWASTPNLNNERVNDAVDTTLNEFVASYQQNGANEMDKKKVSKSKNPVYSSDDSDSGLSPSRTMAHAQVQDFRPVPVRTESGKFMKKYSSPLRDFEDSKSVPDFDLPNGHAHVNEIPLRQRGGSGSVSPTNSLSTNDSTPISPAVSIDTPSSPAKSSGSQYSPAMATKIYGPAGFKTVVDFSKGSGSGQVTEDDDKFCHM